MNIILHLAISADGFIARPDGDSDWVSAQDEELFEARAREAGCLVVGRSTFEQYQDEIYPVEDVLNIVISRSREYDDDGIVTARSVEAALELADEANKDILVAGGGKTSTAFLKKGVVDEIFLSVHPFILGDGIKAFEDFSGFSKMKLVDTRELDDDVVELHYRV